MTQLAGTFDTFDQVGIREDLANAIYMISPVDTPFVSLVPHVQATNTLHEWQTDSLAAAADNKVVQGDDVDADSSTATSRLNNRTQLSDKAPRVTSTSRAVDTAGRADELDYQMLKRGRELRRDVETACLSNKAKVTGSSSVASELAGVPAWIATNTDFDTGGADPTGDGTDARTDGTQRAFTEDQLKTVLKEIFDEGGMPDILMLGAFNRQIASSFSAGRTNVQKAEDSVLHATFDVYESDFGRLKIIPNRFQRGRDALILQTDMWAFATLQDFHTFDLAKTGHSDARVVAIEYTVEARQEKSSGIVADLTTS